MKKRMTLASLVLGLVLAPTLLAQDSTATMDKVYLDESHCLTGPEIRSSADNPISCYCRDALADAHYIYSTYVLTEKDRNLNGTFLRMEMAAQNLCGKAYNSVNAVEEKDWQWDGPEVVRTYPSDSEIARIKPDSNGFRVAEYKIRLAYHDKTGRTTRVETFATRAPLDFKPTIPAIRKSPREH